jgi:hypothetical protein
MFISKQLKSGVALAASATFVVGATAAPAGFLTSIPGYAVPVISDYSILPLLSSGDRVPRTGLPGLEYQFVGIPDGMGAHTNADGTLTVLISHEFGNNSQHEPCLLQPLNRGAMVSRFVLAPDGSVLEGDRAYDALYTENVLYGPPAEIGNLTPGFSRFCSGSLSWQEAGFDRPIYFTGEEASGLGTFDGRGGLLVAVFDNNLWTVPKAGRIAWENALVQPKAGAQTVIMCMEDGAVMESQLYMYVGVKERGPGAGPLRRNGLDNGALYVFVSNNRKKNSEVNVQDGTIAGKWVLIPGAEHMTDAQLEIATDSVGAFAFARPEDGAFSKTNPDTYYFVTTGGGTGNMLGRLYRLDLNPDNVLGGAKLTVVYNADHVVADGGDIAVSPDNIDVSEDYLMINEDGTGQSRVVMAEKGRNGNIWRLNLHTGAMENVAEMTAVGRTGATVNPGVWETTGIIDASAYFGPDSWLFNVQAHSPTPAPPRNTVEDGQLLLMYRNR